MSFNSHWQKTKERDLNRVQSLGLLNIVILGLVLTLGWSNVWGKALTESNGAHQTWATPMEHPFLPRSQLQGQANHRYFGLRIYDAQLWTQAGFMASNWSTHPLVLQLNYHRSFQGQAIAERSLQEMRRAGPLSTAQANQWLEAMGRLFPNVKPGEQIVGLYLPGLGARFWHQGQLRGEINDTEFARLFFGIWLAPYSSEPRMRLALLGTEPINTAP